jgi:molybdate transport system ATP-binding protein
MSVQARYSVKKGVFLLQVDIKLPATGITAIYGVSGSGKTTLLRALAGLDSVSEGYLKIGSALWHSEEQCLPVHQRPLGYVFQEASLFSHLNVAQNIEFGRQRATDPLSDAALDDVFSLLALHPLLQRNVETLSGGEQQRVAIARALAVNPKLLLMDEPLSGLDESRKLEVLPYLQRLQASLKVPILYVTHSADEVARIADYLVILEAGKVVAQGAAVDMLTRLDLPLAKRSDAEAIIRADVIGYDQHYHLTQLSFSGGVFIVTSTGLAVGETVRLRIAARDVSITLEKQIDTSILNILPAEVVGIERLNDGQTLVQLELGAEILLARITDRSVEQLGLIIGMRVWAQVKSAAVLS